MERPSGTVTFLFTDIEGSTALWETQPEAMAAALARHDVLVRGAVEPAGGHVFKTMGDAFCVAFWTPKRALEAALAVQKAVSSEPWPEPIALRVRTVLHTGVCQERDGDYFGPVVNRAARLEAIVHGGQTVLSRATAELLRDSLPQGVGLRDLGDHRLKDLSRPERVFQVDAVGLPQEFPPLLSLDNPELENNLPVQLTSFVGRVRELAEIRELVNGSRLVTLTGAGGSGKTRLALQAAAELVGGSRDGVWFVDLAPLSDAALVPAAIASVLGVREEPGRPVSETVLDALQDRHVRIVMDNCEHLIDAAAKMIDSIMRTCPQVDILATSRERLNIDGEVVYRVPSLGLSEDHIEIQMSDAVQLFVERARSHRPSLELDADGISAVATLCRRLDGMPLAIELAAARLQAMSVSDINDRLDNRFRFLTKGSRTVIPRHQTLRSVIDWSYDLLVEEERRVLCQLSVFAGGWDLAAAEFVCTNNGIDAFDVDRVLDSLVDKSLVQVETTAFDARYRLLETIRQYGADRLRERGGSESSLACRRHALCFLERCEVARRYLAGSEQAEWFDRMELEHDNMRLAFTTLLSQLGRPNEALRMAVALKDFWFCEHRAEGAETLDRVLSHADSQDSGPLRVEALLISGYLYLEHGELGRAEDQMRRSVEIAREASDAALLSHCLGGLTVIARRRGDDKAALTLADEAVTLAQQTDDCFAIAEAFNHRGETRLAYGSAGASNDFSKALKNYRDADDLFGLVRVLQNLAALELKQGNLASARSYIDEALRVRKSIHGQGIVLESFVIAGLVALFEGDLAGAHDQFFELFTSARRLSARSLLPYALLGLGLCARAVGDDDRAASFHGAADRLFGTHGQLMDVDLARLRDYDLASIHEALGDKAFADAFEAGGSLSLTELASMA